MLVLGLFRLYENAAEAVDLIDGAGIAPDSISAIVPADYDKRRRDRDRSDAGPGMILAAFGVTNTAGSGIGGETLSGGLSNTLNGATPMALPGLGRVLFTGRLGRRAGEGMGAGKQAQEGEANLVDILVREGVSEDMAAIYAEGVKRGGFLIVCHAGDRAAEVRHLMNQANAADTTTLSEGWEDSGWDVYDFDQTHSR